jgi:hypothetical protein
MSTRERWIVYPLLLLTLGIVMRDKVMPQGHFQANEVAAGRIHCGQLQVDRVASADGIAVRSLQCREGLTAGKLHCGQLQVDNLVAAGGLVVRGIKCGELVVGGPNGRPTVIARTDPKTKGGTVITLSSAGVPLILLQPTDSGGVVFASDVKRVTGVAPHENPKTPPTRAPQEPSKEPEKAPAKVDR